MKEFFEIKACWDVWCYLPNKETKPTTTATTDMFATLSFSHLASI